MTNYARKVLVGTIEQKYESLSKKENAPLAALEGTKVGKGVFLAD